MAVLNITEFANAAQGPAGAMQIAQGPPLAFQNITISTESDTAAFNAATRYVRLKAGADCAIKWGVPEQTATTGSMILSSGDTEYIGVSQGDEISVIALS